MGPGQPRWIEVVPKGAQSALVLYKPSKDMPGASTYEAALSMIGTFTPFVLNVEDMDATYQELKSKGVEFPNPPEKQFYGWWATIKDQDGNTIGMHSN